MSNQYRFLTNSQSVPPSSYIPGALNLTQTAPASVLSNYRYDSPGPNLSLGPGFHTPTGNGVLKDRNSQQQQQLSIDKRNRSLKDPLGSKLSTLSETPLLPGQERVEGNEQITPTSTPTQKRKETKRKSNIFTVSSSVNTERTTLSLSLAREERR